MDTLKLPQPDIHTPHPEWREPLVPAKPHDYSNLAPAVDPYSGPIVPEATMNETAPLQGEVTHAPHPASVLGRTALSLREQRTLRGPAAPYPQITRPPKYTGRRRTGLLRGLRSRRAAR